MDSYSVFNGDVLHQIAKIIECIFALFKKDSFAFSPSASKKIIVNTVYPTNMDEEVDSRARGLNNELTFYYEGNLSEESDVESASINSLLIKATLEHYIVKVEKLNIKYSEDELCARNKIDSLFEIIVESLKKYPQLTKRIYESRSEKYFDDQIKNLKKELVI